MSASVIVTNAVSALLLPPLNLILVCAAGLVWRRRWPRFGLTVSASALVALLVFSTSAGALLLVAPLEQRTGALASLRPTGAQAIVVLSGGRIENAPEYGGQAVPAYSTLVRLRYAAKLHRETGLPLLVTGGAPDGSDEAEAVSMARSLRDDFSVPVKWIEEESHDTAQNAEFSERLLKHAGVRRILLVTDALHMPRAQLIFERHGMKIIPAATMWFSHDRLKPLHFLPSGEGLRRSHYALHEWIGIAWYWLRHDSALRAVEERPS
jgi:uncharacterized SAM-binding protein YcdF (DUF218 family)